MQNFLYVSGTEINTAAYGYIDEDPHAGTNAAVRISMEDQDLKSSTCANRYILFCSRFVWLKWKRKTQ